MHTAASSRTQKQSLLPPDFCFKNPKSCTSGKAHDLKCRLGAAGLRRPLTNADQGEVSFPGQDCIVCGQHRVPGVAQGVGACRPSQARGRPSGPEPKRSQGAGRNREEIRTGQAGSEAGRRGAGHAFQGAGGRGQC